LDLSKHSGDHRWPLCINDYSLSPARFAGSRVHTHHREWFAAEFERPVLLFSGGRTRFVHAGGGGEGGGRARVPFPVMHVRHRHNSRGPRLLRDSRWRRRRAVYRGPSVQEYHRRRAGVCRGDRPVASANRLKDHDAARAHRPGTQSTRCSAVPAGRAKARAKERVFLVPGRVRPVGSEQRPRLWASTNNRIPTGPTALVGCSRCPLDRANVWSTSQQRGRENPVHRLRAHAQRVGAAKNLLADGP